MIAGIWVTEIGGLLDLDFEGNRERTECNETATRKRREKREKGGEIE